MGVFRLLNSAHNQSLSYNSYAEQYEETFFWLSNSMISNECFLCADPNVGLSVNEDRGYIKCYLGDTGLLFSHAFDENEHKLFFYRHYSEEKHRNDIEIDFLISNSSKLKFKMFPTVASSTIRLIEQYFKLWYNISPFLFK